MKIRFYGCPGEISGYGTASTELAMCLREVGEIDVVPYTFGSDPAELRRTVDPSPDVVVIHAQPLDCAKILHESGLRGPHGQPKFIAYTTWESSSPISYEVAEALSLFDQVWVPCWSNEVAIRSGLARAGTSVRVVPHSFDEQTFDARRSTTDPDGQSPFRFYFIGHSTARKNIPRLILAWARAFTKDDNVEIRIHSTGMNENTIAMICNAVGAGVRDDLAPIRVTDMMSAAGILDLHRTSDCFVTASMWESWNLPAFDALLAGRMIIAPENSGSDDYLQNTTARRIPIRRTPAFDHLDIAEIPDRPGMAKISFSGPQGVSARVDWHEPDLLQLASQMRIVYDANRRDIMTTDDLQTKFGRRAVTAQIRALLEAP